MDVVNLIFLVIISIILSLATIRDIMVKFNFLPNFVTKSKILSKIFEPNYEIQILKKALIELGLSNPEIKDITRIIKEYKDNLKIFDKHLEYLISLIVNYIYQLSGERGYSNNKLKSKYYIHTMEMAHDNEKLIKITNIMIKLIINSRHFKNKEIDFIIVPKGGNPLLAKSVSNKLNANLLVLKDEKEASCINVDISNNPKEYFITHVTQKQKIV